MNEQITTDPSNRLTNAAADLFHARSYGSVGIQDVCDAASVRRGSFYYYFQSKDELGIAALERSTDRVIDAVHSRAFSGNEPSPTQLSQFVDLLQRYYADRSDHFGVQVGCPIAKIAEELSTISTDLREKADQQFGRIRSYYEAFVRHAMERGEAPPGDAATVARRFLALVQGALLQAKVAGDGAVLADLAGSLGLITGLHTDP